MRKMSDRTNASGFNALRNAITEFADVQRAQFEAASPASSPDGATIEDDLRILRTGPGNTV